MIYASVHQLVQETDNTKSFILKISESHILDQYKAGQFLILSSMHNPERRSYSIVTIIDQEQGLLQITVKRIENGYLSRLLNDNTLVGDQLIVHGISGMFTLPENLSSINQINYFVAGSGITPAFAMMDQLLKMHADIKVHLYYSTKSPEKTIFQQEIDSWIAMYPNQLRVTFFYSESNDILNARLNNTKLTQILSQYHIEELRHHLCYICGPTDYMDMVNITLLTEGVPKANIKKEQFAIDIPELDELPPDTHVHSVRIHHAVDEIKTVTVQYPQSILDAAQKAGIAVPYSCRSGQCGSCAARILKGKVWMSYNEVLTDKDIEQGLTLTCRGYPINGDVELSYI